MEFTSLGADIAIRWNASLNAYEVTLPSGASGKIVPSQPGWSVGKVVAADGTVISPIATVRQTPYAYTSWASVGGDVFAFGIATPAGAVPTKGSASYAAEIEGIARAPDYEFIVYGEALFQFDFGAGTLSGYMDPKLNGPMGGPTLPRYTFTQTV
jgi:hypothetical protein